MKPAEVYQRLPHTLQQDAVLNTRCGTRIPVDRLFKFQTATPPDQRRQTATASAQRQDTD